MDNEMINRVAEAILNTPNASDYKTLVACNAIKAMREPTQEILAFRIMSDAEKDSLKADWQAMIDSIVND